MQEELSREGENLLGFHPPGFLQSYIGGKPKIYGLKESIARKSKQGRQSKGRVMEFSKSGACEGLDNTGIFTAAELFLALKDCANGKARTIVTFPPPAIV
jgi:hypothetical protein